MGYTEWAYYEADWSSSCELEHLERTIYDSNCLPQMENSADTDSNSSGSSALSDPPDVLFHIPEFIHFILDGHRQFSFDVQFRKHCQAGSDLDTLVTESLP